MSTERDSTENSVDPIEERSIGLFTYLKKLATLRVKTVRDCFNYEKLVWFNDIPHEDECFTIVWGSEGESSDDLWIEIKRPKEPKCPKVPEICRDWVELEFIYYSDEEPDELLDKLRDRILGPEEEVDGLKEGVELDDEEIRQPVFLDRKDYPEVDEVWLEYIYNEWEPWAEKHRRWKSVQKVYTDLFTIDQQQKRLGEQYELVLGLGLLVWKTPSDQRVRRHLLVGKADLNIDSEKGTITVEPGAEGTELHLEMDMLEAKEWPDPSLQESLKALIEKASETPFAREIIEPILKSVVHSIDPEAEYTHDLEQPKEFMRKPQSSFAPAVILRKRTARTLVRSFSTIIEEIERSHEVPFGIRRLCEIVEEKDFRPDDSDAYPSEKGRVGEVNGKTYLPLPANDEQLDIIEHLESKQGILVQGPPGTGKSHTIANLICHLLATGKRILVTSEGPRALEVLSDMLPNDIVPLCVSFLGNDASSVDNLERSVRGIAEGYTNRDKKNEEMEIEQLEKQVDELRKNQANINGRLRELREIESNKHSPTASPTYRGKAKDIAAALYRNQDTHGWIPDNVDENADIPFDVPIAQYLLKILREVPDERAQELQQSIVPKQDLPTIEEFIKLIDDERSAYEVLSSHGERVSTPLLKRLLDTDESIRSESKKAVEVFGAALESAKKRSEDWIDRAVSEILTDHDLPWKELRDTTDNYLQDLREKARGATARKISFPEGKDPLELRADAERLLAHIEAKGKIGIWMLQGKEIKKTRYIAEQVKVDGRLCNEASSLRELIDTFRVEESLDRLWEEWSGFSNRVEGSYTHQVAELDEHLEALEIVLALEEPLQEAKDTIRKIEGLPEPTWNETSSIQEMLDDLEAVEASELYNHAKSSIDGYLNKVQVLGVDPNSHPVNTRAVDAIETRDVHALGEVIDELTHLEDDRRKVEKRDEILSKLEQVAPRLAKALTEDPENSLWDERLTHLGEAWVWKQADTWHRRFLEDHQEEQLEAEYQINKTRLEKAMASLASVRAWRFCLERMTERQRQHLMAWLRAVKKFGKGKSKYIETYRDEARRNMEACLGAIPAWIMPFYRVVETIEPKPNMFDVVIIDEASQSGPDAVLLMYIAKQCIVVGDDQQISPERPGINLEEVHELKRHYLKGIPVSESLGLTDSLFSLARIKYPAVTTLREHFRCMPEIIEFSNHHFYSSTPLWPLRQYPPDHLKPIELRHVSDGYREGRTPKVYNVPEAEKIVEAIAECCENPAYEGKTMGVIQLLGGRGGHQASLIESRLLERIGPEEFMKRELRCGDAYDFQGDERDVIFLSLVAAPIGADGQNITITPLTRDEHKKRFNVAASRAKDQVWLFHTATLNDLNQDDWRYKLLDYYQNPQPIHIPDDEIDESIFGSKFEKDVFERIRSRGYRVRPQFKVGKYFIDLVVEGVKTKLAVECDGDEYHGPDQYHKDMDRQRNLERCGWRFWRVRESKFSRDPDAALEPLWEELEELGIYPRREVEDSHEPPIPDDDPIDRDEADETYTESQEDERESAPIVEVAEEKKDISSFDREYIREKILEGLPPHGKVERDKAIRAAAGELKKEGLQFIRLHSGGRIYEVIKSIMAGALRMGLINGDRKSVWKSPESEISTQVQDEEAVVNTPDEPIEDDDKEISLGPFVSVDDDYTAVFPEKTEKDEEDQEEALITDTRRYFNDDLLNDIDLWEAMGDWAEDTEALSQLDRQVIWNVYNVMRDGWHLTAKERTDAEKVAEKAFNLGFQFTPSEETGEDQLPLIEEDTRKEKRDISIGPTAPKIPYTVSKRTRGRRRKGGLSVKDCYIPLLLTLEKLGGRADTDTTCNMVKRLVEDKIKSSDHDLVGAAQVPKWRNTIQWTRKRLIDDGLLEGNSPRGIWEISEQGRKYLQSQGLI
ncbi:MAG: DUF559 domain-containing protein [Candidatus Brocadiales bacterium]|nr:DUF559 domain-containing protein [Candidatus Bathyanammoxibius sp.]